MTDFNSNRFPATTDLIPDPEPIRHRLAMLFAEARLLRCQLRVSCRKEEVSRGRGDSGKELAPCNH